MEQEDRRRAKAGFVPAPSRGLLKSSRKPERRSNCTDCSRCRRGFRRRRSSRASAFRQCVAPRFVFGLRCRSPFRTTRQFRRFRCGAVRPGTGTTDRRRRNAATAPRSPRAHRKRGASPISSSACQGRRDESRSSIASRGLRRGTRPCTRAIADSRIGQSRSAGRTTQAWGLRR